MAAAAEYSGALRRLSNHDGDLAALIRVMALALEPMRITSGGGHHLDGLHSL